MFGLFSKKEHQLIVQQQAPIQLMPKETVLNGALRGNIAFPHSCKVGGCGACKCILVSGKVKELTDKSYLLSKEEIESNYILGCQSIPKTDVVVTLPENCNVSVQGVIQQQIPLTHDISEIIIQLDNPIQYKPGQYAIVEAQDIAIPARCYSFAHASDPLEPNKISFFVRAVPQGKMSNWLLSKSALGHSVSIQSSFGDFFIRPPSVENAQTPLLCIAGGSGLAPLIALFEGMLQESLPSQRNVILMLGARTQNDLYYIDEINNIAQQWQGNFQFQPVLSDEPESTDWLGLRGFVTDHIQPHITADMQSYLCGPPPMIDAAILELTQGGLSSDHIYFDKFSDQSIEK